jgi:membrane-anchored protein YejM (alkaline phosphatase superfamily)
MNIFILVLCLLSSVFSNVSPGAAPRTEPIVPQSASASGVNVNIVTPDIKNALRRKVLIIGIDGLRPDVLLSGHAPNLKALIRSGAFAPDASADSITRSGPGWASVLTGVWHDKHHVYDNGIAGYDREAYPAFFKRLKEKRPELFTACIVNWAPIRDKLMSGIDLALAPENDDSVAARAAGLLLRGDPDLLFLHFDAPDHAGHEFGFSRFSPPYRNALARTDALIGKVLEAMQARPSLYKEDWLILCTTDHGGSWRHHGQDIPAHRTVFLIVSGNESLRGTAIPNASLVDLAPTVMAYLGVRVDPAWGWEGRAVGLKQPAPETMQANQAGPGASPGG